MVKRWMGRKLASFDRNGLAPRGFCQTREQRVTGPPYTLKGKSINARLLNQLVGAKESVRLLQSSNAVIPVHR